MMPVHWAALSPEIYGPGPRYDGAAKLQHRRSPRSRCLPQSDHAQNGQSRPGPRLGKARQGQQRRDHHSNQQADPNTGNPHLVHLAQIDAKWSADHPVPCKGEQHGRKCILAPAQKTCCRQAGVFEKLYDSEQKQKPDRKACRSADLVRSKESRRQRLGGNSQSGEGKESASETQPKAGLDDPAL